MQRFFILLFLLFSTSTRDLFSGIGGPLCVRLEPVKIPLIFFLDVFGILLKYIYICNVFFMKT